MNVSSLLSPLFLGLLFLLLSPSEGCTSIPFQELGLEEAQKQAYQKDKLFFLYFTAEWCMPCRWMEEETFHDPSLSSYVKANYLAVKVDISKAMGRVLQEQFEVSSLPSILVFDALGHLVDRREASQEAEPLLRWLKRLDKPANHLDPRLHTTALAGSTAMDTPKAELHFFRPALLTESSPPMLSQTQIPVQEEMIIVYQESANSNSVFTPRSAQHYGVKLEQLINDYSEGIRMVAEMERKHQQRAELQPLGNGQFYLLLGNFETTGQANSFLNYLQRNDQKGEIVALENR
jgi:thiol-disulfide isomerase/thioredoxin